MFQNLLYSTTLSPDLKELFLLVVSAVMKVIFFLFFVNEHIILSMKGRDVRNTYLLTEHKNTSSKEKKLIYVLGWDLIFYQSD